MLPSSCERSLSIHHPPPPPLAPHILPRHRSVLSLERHRMWVSLWVSHLPGISVVPIQAIIVTHTVLLAQLMPFTACEWAMACYQINRAGHGTAATGCKVYSLTQMLLNSLTSDLQDFVPIQNFVHPPLCLSTRMVLSGLQVCICGECLCVAHHCTAWRASCGPTCC